VTLIDLTVSLCGVLLILPAALVLAENGELGVRVRALAQRAGTWVPARIRRARVA
jgi:hypothetical protein